MAKAVIRDYAAIYKRAFREKYPHWKILKVKTAPLRGGLDFYVFLYYIDLSLYASRAVAARKRLNLFSCYEVKVAGDCVLQCRRRNAELKSILKVLAVNETADRAARERVAAAYAVNDGRNSVLSGVIEFLGIS